MKPLVIVYIKWIDAHGGSGQHPLKTALDSRPDLMETAGILVNELYDCVTIVQDLFGGESSYDGERQVRAFETIPMVNIRQMLRWEVPQEAPK